MSRNGAAAVTDGASLGGADDAYFAAPLFVGDHARPAAVGASVLGVERNAHLGAAHRVAQRHFDLGVDIASARRFFAHVVTGIAPGGAATRAAGGKSPAQAAEELLEKITEAARAAVAAVARPVIAAGRSAPSVAAPHLLFGGAALPVRAELVVFLALGRITEDLIGLVDLLEASLGFLVVGIDVGMIFAGKFAVGRFDLGRRRAALHAQGF